MSFSIFSLSNPVIMIVENSIFEIVALKDAIGCCVSREYR